MTSLELLKEIEAWLCFNTEPSKEETAKLRKSINEHVSEQLRLGAVSGSFLCALASEKRCETQCFTCSEDQKCDELHTKNLR